METDWQISTGIGPVAKALARVRNIPARLGMQVPAALRDELTLLQYEQLSALMPVLFITIAIIVGAGALGVVEDFSILIRLGFPAIIIGFSVLRCITWQRRRGKSITPDVARRHVRGTLISTMTLSFVGGMWSVNAFFEIDESRRVLAVMFITLAALASSNCLASVPRAAILAIVIGLTPISLAMLATPDIGVRVAAVSLIVVAVLQVRLVVSKFADAAKSLILQHEMRELAETDSLTGLRNRRAFSARLESESAALAPTEMITLVMIDLDGFKPANDCFGHAAGDAVLVEVARRLQTLCVSAACIARVGGDEFAVIFGPEHSQAGVSAIVESAKAVISLPYVFGTEVISVSASMGVASAPGGAVDFDALLQAADRALYTDKAARFNRALGTARQATASKRSRVSHPTR